MSPLVSPSPELLRLGAGQLFADRWDAAGLSTGFRHIGNLTSLEITLTPDVLIKRSTMTRTRPVYKKLTRSIDTVVRAVADEWNIENLAMFLMGDIAYGTDAGTPVTDAVVYADVPTGTLGEVLGGQIFFVGGFNIDSVSMDLGATALAAGSWEVYNAAAGLVRILPGAVEVTDGTKDLTVSYTPQAIAGTESPIVRGATVADVQCSLLYIEDNTLGENHIFRAWSASVTPDGALGLISDDFASMALNFTLQDDSRGAHGGSAADPLFHLQLVPALVTP